MSVPTSAELEEHFQNCLAAGKLEIQVCDATGAAQWYPRTHSVYGRGGVHWREASGRGSLFSFSVMHRGQAPETARLYPPMTVGLVELDEGPLLLARIETNDLARLHVGMPVRLLAGTQYTSPVFEPVDL